MIEFEQEALQRQKSMVSIKVIGVGGAGGNAVNSIIESGCQGIGFVVANTDAQALEFSKAQHKIQIGVKSTKGLGAGANPEIGKRAAEEDLDKVMEAISGADIVFIVGGMGGGTGSGGLPVIARALREKGILSIAIVTRPFLFEGKRRAAVADAAIDRLKNDVDTLIIIPNQKLLEVVDEHVSMIDAFAMINEGVLSQSVRGLSDIITRPGHINVDYADIRTIMKDRGLAVMGTGKASGVGRARAAALQAISSPLLENMSVVGAHGVLCNITGGKGLGLHEISEAASVVYEQAHEDANIIIGSVIDENLHDEVIVTIIATDFERSVSPVQAQEKISEYKLEDKQAAPEPVVVEVKEIEVAAVIADKHDVQKQHRSDFFDQADTFGCAVDSKDLDIPTFMRQRND
ncbi:MAG TPA: cell division protein FtsZ [Candidatus Babeliales bacterium]|jgi:cell division protein FtsZ|nr:cell division protein FtsZ [Candidatus Babeliales bacterium]